MPHLENVTQIKLRMSCGKILAPLMRQQMVHIMQWPAFAITQEIARKFKKISPAQIDRYLKKDKADLITRSRSNKKNDNCFVEQKNGAVVREYIGYDRLEGTEEQALLAAVYQHLVPLLNFFMPSQKLKSKTRIGSKEIKVYDEPKSPFQRLMESSKTPQKTKDSLLQQIALYNPVELQHNVNKAIIRLRQRLAQSNRLITKGEILLR